MKKRPPLRDKLTPLIVVCGVLVVIWLASAACNSFSRTASEWSPEDYASAYATETAIAPLLAPTISYNESVIPEIQAAEADAAADRVEQRHEREMSVEQATANVKTFALYALGGAAIAGGALAVVFCVGFGVFVLRRSAMAPARTWRRGQFVETQGAFHQLSGDVGVIQIGEPQEYSVPRLLAINERDVGVTEALLFTIVGGKGYRARIATTPGMTYLPPGEE